MSAAAAPPRLGRFAALALGVLVLSLGLLLGAGRPRVIDEYIVWLQAESLAERGDLAVPQAERAGIWYGVRGRDGRARAPYGPLHAALLAAAVPCGERVAAALGLPPPQRDLARPLPAASVSSLALALVAVLVASHATALGASRACAVAVALCTVFATALGPYAGTLFSEPLAAAFFLLALRPLVRGRHTPLVSGVWLGAALLLRPSHAVAALPFALAWAATDRRWRVRVLRAALLALPVALALGWLLWHNAHVYGDPFEFGYPRTAEGGVAINTFDNPLGRGLVGLLLSPGKSVLLHVPLLVPALWGLVRLGRARLPLALATGGTFLAYLLFFAHYGQWEGGYAWGPRYLLPAAALLCPLAALACRGRCGRRVLAAALLLGLLVNAPAFATSFLEAQRTGRYYDARMRYRLDYGGPVAQWRLVVRHARASGEERVRLGLGWAPAPLFLLRAGAAPGRVALFAGVCAGCALASALALRRGLRPVHRACQESPAR